MTDSSPVLSEERAAVADACRRLGAEGLLIGTAGNVSVRVEDHVAITATGAVLHTHAPLATAHSLVLDELPCIHYQLLALGGTVRVAPYATFGTPELAESVLAALEGRGAALMANHGAVTHAPTLDKAVEHALLLEWACGVYQHAAALGQPRILDEQQQIAVIEAAIARNYGTTHPVPPAQEEER